MDYMSNGLLLKRIHDSLEKKANNQLRPKDLTMMQIDVLMGLRGATEKQLSMKEIEQHFQLAQSTIAGIVKRLEKKGFVESLGDISDKRIKLVRITSAGENCCEEAERYMNETEELLICGFSKEEKELFHTLLSRVAINIK